MSQNVEPVEKEMKELTASYQADKLEFIKNPVIAEFLGLSSNTDFTESELEQRIITHIQKFVIKGKGTVIPDVKSARGLELQYAGTGISE